MHYCPNQSTTVMYRESPKAPQRTEWKVVWFMFAAMSSGADTNDTVKITILAVVPVDDSECPAIVLAQGDCCKPSAFPFIVFSAVAYRDTF